ncbi:MAG TPA: ATP-binding cassette domain-containing protein [Solirubrobacteraceae bacterium]|nr:ATP-binding cassette domain-containing protein [Solirubrobacteraceae bacterium]
MPLQFDHVTVHGAQRPRLSDVTETVPGKGITAITGPSGAGKSTLLRLGNRLIAPDEGTVRYRGTDLATLDVLQHRRRVGMVFQRPVVFAGTVRDNLRVAAPQATDAELQQLLDRCELHEDVLDRDADTLSGGEQQRACLARTLATHPETLLMDEPTSALDAQATHALERLIRQEAERGVAVVLVSHDPAQVDRLADARIALDRGHTRS